MILVDTSVWIEFFRGRDPYFTRLENLLETRQICALECVFAELLQGAKGEADRSVIREMWNTLPQINTTESLLRAGEESGVRKWMDRGIGLIDAWIITAARMSECRVWSLDKKLNSVLSEAECFHSN